MRPSAASPIHIVLLGGGHAHVEALRAFALRPEPGVRLSVIARELRTPYSGMLPGLVAGDYTHRDCHIDLPRLTGFAGARLIHGAADGVDAAARRVTVAGLPPISYDLLAIDVGITPRLDDIPGAAEHALAVKPISGFWPGWTRLEADALGPGGPRRVVVVGGGAAGFELALAAAARLRAAAVCRGLAGPPFRFALVAGDGLLSGLNGRARGFARAALARADVDLIEGDPAVEIAARAVRLASGRRLACDAALATTRAAPPPWFRGTDLPLDRDGFLAARPTLQLVGLDDVFGVGDCAGVLAHPRPKAGVFAVRQGPVLAGNLRRRARGEAARVFTPQRRHLMLLSTGGRHAIAARGRFAAQGRWVWRWKDWIDRRFMRRFAVARPDDVPEGRG